MIDHHHELFVSRQAKLLNISRGTVNYIPRPVSDADLAQRQVRVRVPEGLLRGIAKASGGHIKCPGAPRVAHRVGRSSRRFSR